MYTRPTLRQFAEQYPEFGYAALKQRAKRRRLNGYSAAFVKDGRILRVKPEVFFNILDSQGEGQ